MNEGNIGIETEKSSFVTIVAAIFIALAGLSLIASAFQLLFFSFLFQNSEIFESLRQQINNNQMTKLTGFLFSNIRLISIFSLFVSIIKLIASIGLLKRINWARILFIIMLSLSIGFRMLAFMSQFFIMPDLPQMNSSAGHFTILFIFIIRIFNFIFIAAICILFGWIIKMLSSEKIRREFISNKHGHVPIS